MTDISIDDKSQSRINTKKSNSQENLLLPSNISTVHADRITLAVDYSSETVTMTLLTMHPIPKLTERIDIDNYAYELTGEIKIPFSEMDLISIYYLTTRTSNPNKLLDYFQKHLKEFPFNKKENEGMIRYGPTGVEPTNR